MKLAMSVRSERDRLARELEAARKRIADLEAALLRRGRDTLTTVLRIEAFREQLVDELQRARRRGLQGALVVMQVDRLADIHRDHGFAAGDALLGALVEALRAGTRAEDVIGRIGDDRFALLLREAGEAATSACVARLLGDLQTLEVGPCGASRCRPAWRCSAPRTRSRRALRYRRARRSATRRPPAAGAR